MIVADLTNATPESIREGRSQRLGLPLQPSDELMAFMGVWENGTLNGLNFRHQHVIDGVILIAYYDNRRILTVGCGHRVLPVDEIDVGQVISMERARSLWSNDVGIAVHAINRKVRVPLHQHEFDALVDLSFNCGGGEGVDELARFVNSHDYSEVPDFIKTYRDGHGNHRRRVSEARLFEEGVYNASH